jgi:dethiobiotin synthetase
MAKAWFVTGTDTEVGKTAITCALLEAARLAGMSTAACKPIAAGCDADGHNEDALLMQQHMTLDLPYSQVNPVALTEAIAPHIAAQNEGRRLQASRLAGLCRGVLMAGADFTVIEGAGGWRVPIGPRETLADVAKQLQLEVVLVVGMRLGCINHALLSAEAIRRDGLKLAGWVANSCGPMMASYQENLATLVSMMGAPLLGEVPHIVPFSAPEASKSLSIEALHG